MDAKNFLGLEPEKPETKKEDKAVVKSASVPAYLRPLEVNSPVYKLGDNGCIEVQKEFQKKMDELEHIAGEPNTLEDASEATITALDLARDLDRIRKEIVEQPTKQIGRVNKFFKKLADRLGNIANTGKKCLDTFDAQNYHNGTGSVYKEAKWSHILKDIRDVPYIYLTVDRKEVEAAINAGIRDIPGLKIFEAPVIKTRLKGRLK